MNSDKPNSKEGEFVFHMIFDKMAIQTENQEFESSGNSAYIAGELGTYHKNQANEPKSIESDSSRYRAVPHDL